MACVGDNKDGDEDDGGELLIVVAVNLVAREQTEDNKVNAIDYSLIDCFSTMELGEQNKNQMLWEVKRSMSVFLSQRAEEERYKKKSTQ